MPANLVTPLLRREPLGGGYWLLSFRHPEVAAHARAGQFVMIKSGVSAGLPLRRPFSLMAIDPNEETFTLFVKAVGPGSGALAALQPGEPALCLGPLGQPFALPAEGHQAVLVAGGYGVAPFVLLCRQWPGGRPAPRVFYGGRRAADLPLRDAFEDLAGEIVLATEDGSLGRTGRVTSPLEEHLDSQGTSGPVSLLACGPEAMMRAVAGIAERRRLPCQVSLDPWMGCGMGTCLGCVVRVQRSDEERPRYRCACTDGPVFDAEVVVWPEHLDSLARRRAEVGA